MPGMVVGGHHESGVEQPSFELWDDAPASKAKLIVIDECSMVDAELGRDLMSFDCPLLVLGDPAHVINGDIADVVLAADGENLTRWRTFTAYPLQSSPPCKKGIRPHAKNIPREAARKLSHGGCSIFWVFTQNFRYAFAATACSTAWRASSALMRMSRGLLPWLGPTMPSSAIVSMRRAARV